MKDPVLHAHQIGIRLFSVGGKLLPVSIRDQMIRGRMLVERAYEQQLIGPPHRNIMTVVGAGAAGVSAAIRALELGVPTTLVDRHLQAFSVQTACQSRWLDPTQYDWPADHWRSQSFPTATVDPPLRLEWGAGWAADLAYEWQRRLDKADLDHPGMLKFYKGYQLESRPRYWAKKNVLRVRIVHVKGKSRAVKIYPGAFLLAMGFGKERHYVQRPGTPPHSTWGFPFWATDYLTQPNLGLPAKVQPKILISGAGDGALQDFLRAVTGRKSASEIYDLCDVPVSIERALLNAHDAAIREFNWGCSLGHDHPILDRLHQAHLEAVRQALADATVEQQVDSLIRRELRPGSVQLVFECCHFAHCYGLNHFLALLFATFLERRWGQPGAVLRSGRQLWDIGTKEVGHYCFSDFEECHGKKHWVQLCQYSDCRGTLGPVEQPSFEANVLVLRHGLDRSQFHEDPTPPQFRQMLPYSVYQIGKLSP